MCALRVRPNVRVDDDAENRLNALPTKLPWQPEELVFARKTARTTTSPTNWSRRVASSALAAVLLIGLPLPAHAADSPFPGKDNKTRLEAIETAIKTDVHKALKDLIALGKSKEPADLDFLLELSVTSVHRPVRILAQGGIRDIDAAKGIAYFREKADGQNLLQTVFAIEGMQRLGSKDDVPKLIEFAGNKNTLIAAAALRALPRLVKKKKELEPIVDVSLRHSEARMSDYGAWCVQDVLKKVESASKLYAKIAKKKNDERSIRAEAVVAVLEDKGVPPHKWGDDIKKCREMVAKAPADIEVIAKNKRHLARAQKAVDWMKENTPMFHFILRASAKSLNVPGANPDSHLDLEEDLALVPLSYTGHNERQLAYHLARVAGVLFQKKIGNPYTGHRGWELPIFDNYDLCVVARLYDAGPSGLPRRRFVQNTIEKRPWDGT